MISQENCRPLHIAIIGGGFCGTLTAINLLQNCKNAIHLHLINKGNPVARGVAYSPNNANLLLNVPNGKMSAFADQPDHYLDWLLSKHENKQLNKAEFAKEFSARQLYGNYLVELWENTLAAYALNTTVTEYDDYADDIVESGAQFHICLRNHSAIIADVAVLATGNNLPHLPCGITSHIKSSGLYFGNPWKKEAIENLQPDQDVLIIGNGLTMTDTVAGLVNNGFEGKIHTVSPHGYRLKPSKEVKPPYPVTDLLAGTADHCLLSLFSLFNKHRKKAAALNQSVYPLIDGLRPHLQKLWLSFTVKEKQQFIRHIKPFWETIRHRLPESMYQYINRLRTDKKLATHKGKIQSVETTVNGFNVTLNCEGELFSLKVQRMINCTGPGIDFNKSENYLLQNLFNKGIICPSAFNLGIHAHPEDGAVINAQNERISNLFVIGSNLKGVLWESTAVPELRVQAKKLAFNILSRSKSEFAAAPTPEASFEVVQEPVSIQ